MTVIVPKDILGYQTFSKVSYIVQTIKGSIPRVSISLKIQRMQLWARTNVYNKTQSEVRCIDIPTFSP